MLVMGVVNVTPDSFSDGGRYLDPDRAVEHGLRLAGEGADLVDVGGESTRPGADRPSAQQETDRVVARRGPTTVVRTRHGLVMAGAGIDPDRDVRLTVTPPPRMADRLANEYGLDCMFEPSPYSEARWLGGVVSSSVKSFRRW